MGHLVSMPSPPVCVCVCVYVCMCVCVCVCVCVYFPEVSEMVMPLTPMQGRLNSWYWLCEHLPLRIQTIQFYFNWGLQTEREEVPRLHVAHTQTHTHSHTQAHRRAHTQTVCWMCYSPVISTQSDFNPSLLEPYRDKRSQHNKGCVCVCVCVLPVCVYFLYCCFRCVALWIAVTHGSTNVPLASM